MVIELVEGGTLTDCLDLEYPMPEQAIAYVCKEILKGLKVRHTNRHTHTHNHTHTQPQPQTHTHTNTQPQTHTHTNTHNHTPHDTHTRSSPPPSHLSPHGTPRTSKP